MIISKHKIEQELKEVGLSRIASALADCMKVGVQLITTPVDDSEAPVGVSKIGGLPDMPPGVDWPTWKGGPLSFVAQLQLSELQASKAGEILPAQGLLYFFYDPEQQAWGYDPTHFGRWAVLYSACPDSTLARTAAPADLPDYALYGSCLVSFSETVTYPPFDSRIVDSLGLTESEEDAYLDYLEKLEQEREPSHQVLGHPSAVQGDMQLECQLVSHGLYCGDSTGYEDPRAIDLEVGVGDWQLLLQLGSDDCSNMMWGDCGKLYFWITKDSLSELNFDEVWTVLQCH